MGCRLELPMPAEMCVLPVRARARSPAVRSESALPVREAAKSGRREAECDSARRVRSAGAAVILAGNALNAAARAGSAKLKIWKSRFRPGYRPGHAFGLR